MKQVFQSLKNGQVSIDDVPIPAVKAGYVLVKTTKSLISAGTEKILLNFGRSNYLGKAIQQPDKVKQALDKIKTDGIMATYESISNKLNEPMEIGYCNVGKVIAVGEGVTEFKIGDRVASNGKHAEIVNVSKNLCAKIPDEVNDAEAVFTILGSIGLHGIRLSNPSIGEKYAVIGLGLIGLITIQILKAHGCECIGFEYDEDRIKIANELGFETIKLSHNINNEEIINNFQDKIGFDSSIITASSKTSEPIDLAAGITRKRGNIILVGVADIKLSREIFYHKEINFKVSCSYGPGRYDSDYEEKGIDYPIEYVRWTEKRNFNTILSLLKQKLINVRKLITHEFDIKESDKAFDIIINEKKSLGVVINYDQKDKNQNLIDENIILSKNINISEKKENIEVGFIGAGNYARVLAPIFKRNKTILKTISSSQGVSSTNLGKKYGFKISSSNNNSIYDDKSIDAIVICTQHNSHSYLVKNAIDKNKHIFVEKPLALKLSDLDDIEKKLKASSKILTVGFNRRFSPHIIKIKSLIENIKSPKSITININAGKIDKDHWLLDNEIGGGRLIGEAIHHIDLMRYIINKKVTSWNKVVLGSGEDTFSIQLNFKDGSIGVINYFSNGSKSMQKERLELFVDNKILVLNNFISLIGYGWKNFKYMRTWRQDKGQKVLVARFLNAISKNQQPPIPYDEIIEVNRLAINISQKEK